MRQWRNLRSVITGTILLSFSLYFIIKAFHFFEFTPEVLGKYFSIRWVLAGHILGGAIALLIGPLQLWKPLRQMNWKLHRVLGRIYVYAIFIGGSCALYLASTAAFKVNWMYAYSLQVLAAVWLVATLTALLKARSRQFQLHEEWMVRSYLSTVAFVSQSFAITLPFLPGDYAEHSASVIWSSWTIPLFIYDVWLAFRKKKPKSPGK
jgi:uncharacterized membrane protein